MLDRIREHQGADQVGLFADDAAISLRSLAASLAARAASLLRVRIRGGLTE